MIGTQSWYPCWHFSLLPHRERSDRLRSRRPRGSPTVRLIVFIASHTTQSTQPSFLGHHSLRCIATLLLGLIVTSSTAHLLWWVSLRFHHEPPRCSGPATPWLACPYGGGGTQCKGLLSQQMASGSAITAPNLRVGKTSLCSSHATTGTPRVQRKTKRNKIANSRPSAT